MRLFTIDNNYQVELNKEWILMHPQFSLLVKRDKGSEGDYRGDKKLKARKELTFIYFDLDFTSPIREWDDYERREESMKFAGLKESDLDSEVMDAHAAYNALLLQSSRSLKTLRNVEHSLNALDDYFLNLDFTLTDKKGELLHSPGQYLINLKRLGEAFTAVDSFKKRVQDEMKGEASIRGTAMLGRNEAAGRGEWKENNSTTVKTAEPVSFSDIAGMLSEDEEEDDT